jgi:hypothetical protein
MVMIRRERSEDIETIRAVTAVAFRGAGSEPVSVPP